MCSFFPCEDKLKTSLNLPRALISSLQGYLAAYNKSQTMGDSCQKKKEKKKCIKQLFIRTLNKIKL